MNTSDYLLQNGKDHAIALITDNASYTYRELRTLTNHIAGQLKASGITFADRVALIGPNSAFWVATYLAILKLGAVAVPLSTLLKPAEVANAVQFTQCKTICLPNGLSRKLAPTLGGHPVLVFDEIAANTMESDERSIPSQEIDARREEAALMMTSGTTARPKVIRVSPLNIQANTESIIQALDLNDSERIMAILPFHYCFGLSLLHTHLRVGGTIVLNNRFAFPEIVLDAIQKHQCTGFAGVPSTYQTLLRNSTLPKRHLSSLRKVQQAGGKLPVPLIKELAAVLPEAEIYIMYGQTEATARLSCLPPSMLQSKIGSIGRGVPGVVLRVLDTNGQPIRPGEVGEIVASGDNITLGYLDDVEATSKTFVNHTLKTGDLATVDEDGFITIVDRQSDFIKPSGIRVSSQVIEECVLNLNEVIAAAAIGEPDAATGEAIKVFVCLRPDATISTGDILAHCKQHLAYYMVPKTIVVVSSLPTNDQGKVVKSALKTTIPDSSSS